jgi:ParB family chromosome partitioning protein
MSSATDKLKKRAAAAQTSAEREILIPLEKLKFDPTQPRKAYHMLDGRVSPEAEAYIVELAGSIKENGLIEAITVQEQPDGTYLVVVGECRTRAHLHLGLATIRATVRNDLTNPSRRLIYQIAENVNRQDLTDEELAISIRLLLESGNDGKPMSQVAIAKHLGKSEGWVTRFVKFGDDELRRVWVTPGIVDSPEKLYRVSLLSKPSQMDLLRRVELPESDPEHLEIPLNRTLIDNYTRIQKEAKNKEAFNAQVNSAAVAETAQASTHHQASEPAEKGGRVVGEDPINLAMQDILLNQQKADQQKADQQASVQTAPAGKYTLSEEVRLQLLSENVMVTNSGGSMTADEAKQTPVHCRVSVKNMEALLKLLEEDEDSLDSARSMRCDLIIPPALAGKIAAKLAGVVVDPQELSSVLQTRLVDLS